MLKNLFKPREGVRIGDALYALAVEQARQPGLYTRLGVADRIDARFELYTLHVLLLVLRQRDENTPNGRDAAQALFDVYVSALDHVLREEGVGDVAVGKKMRKLGEALYGRMNAYEQPLRAGNAAALAEAARLVAAGGRLMIVGEEIDREAAHTIRYAVPRARVIELQGRLTRLQTAAALSKAVLYVGADSIWTQLAVAAGTPVIAVFGPSDETVRGPWKGVAVRGPRSFEEFRKLDPNLNQAIQHMMDLPWERVLKAAQKVLRDRG
jgi:hypothetical protein